MNSHTTSKNTLPTSYSGWHLVPLVVSSLPSLAGDIVFGGFPLISCIDTILVFNYINFVSTQCVYRGEAMDSWIPLLLNTGAILIGSVFAYLVCVIIPITHRIEIRQTSHFPPHTIPLPPPSINFIQRLQWREQVIKSKLTIAFIVICVVQIALFATVLAFPIFISP